MSDSNSETIMRLNFYVTTKIKFSRLSWQRQHENPNILVGFCRLALEISCFRCFIVDQMNICLKNGPHFGIF